MRGGKGAQGGGYRALGVGAVVTSVRRVGDCGLTSTASHKRFQVEGRQACRRAAQQHHGLRLLAAPSEALAVGQEGVPLARVVVADALGTDGANLDARAHAAAAAGAAVVLGGVAAHLACRVEGAPG